MKYSTKRNENKVFTGVMVIILLALIVMIVLEISGVFSQPVWKPTEEYPIANMHIIWEGAGI